MFQFSSSNNLKYAEEAIKNSPKPHSTDLVSIIFRTVYFPGTPGNLRLHAIEPCQFYYNLPCSFKAVTSK